MAISLKHTFQSAKADGADTTLVQPSNWNAEHTITAAAGKVLGRDTSGAGAVQELPIAVDTSGNVALGGALSVDGNTTLGNASTDSVTVNAGTVSIPNNVNFSGGNVGIGTSSPGAKLHVFGNNGTFGTNSFFGLNGSTPGIAIGNSGSIGLIQGQATATSSTSADIGLQVNGGNLGIGTSSPGGRLDLNGNFVSNITAVAASAINCTSGNFFTKTASGALTWTISNAPASRAYSFLLELTNGGTGTQTWFTGTKWPGGTAPTLTTSGVDLLGFITDDGGTTWRGVQLMKDSK